MLTSWTRHNQDFNYPILHKANELDIERGRYFARLLTEVVAAGHITPLPVLLMPDGLASVKKGFELMMEGKVCSTIEFLILLGVY